MKMRAHFAADSQLWSRELRRKAEVPLILAVRVVDQNDRATSFEHFEQFGDRCKRLSHVITIDPKRRRA